MKEEASGNEDEDEEANGNEEETKRNGMVAGG